MDERVTDRLALVFAGGDRESAVLARGLPPSAIVIAADSGVEQAQSLGVAIDLVVGDLDSVTPAALELARAAGAEVEQHPAAKNHTDLALALLAARDRGCGRVVVVGGRGGRLDHFVANALLLASDELAGLAIEARMGTARIVVVRDEVELDGRRGELLSLLPVGGVAVGVRTRGLRYPLDHEDLPPGSSRGVSNEFLEPVAGVALHAGTLLAVQPNYSEGSI